MSLFFGDPPDNYLFRSWWVRLSSADCSWRECSGSTTAFYAGYTRDCHACAAGFCAGAFACHGVSALGLESVGLGGEDCAFYDVWSVGCCEYWWECGFGGGFAFEVVDVGGFVGWHCVLSSLG